VSDPVVTIHVLRHGRALCGFMPGVVPGFWPEGREWIRLEEAKDATCDACKRAAEELLARPRAT